MTAPDEARLALAATTFSYYDPDRGWVSESLLTLLRAALPTIVHVLGCPRWQTTPAVDCTYRRIHVQDAEARGPALLSALALALIPTQASDSPEKP